MGLIQVDERKCIKCDLCAKVCPIGIIEMDAEGFPQTSWEKCIACGHCVSVCPNAALDHQQAPLAHQVSRNESLDLKVDQAVEFLRSRRSIREFKQDPVSHDDIVKMLDMARFAPTPGNSQGVSYLIIDNKETLKQITEHTIKFIEENNASQTPDTAGIRQHQIDRYYNKQQDVVLLNAPCLILALLDKKHTYKGNPHRSATLSMIYAALFAPVVGLATCWAGLAEAPMFADYRPVLDLLPIPEGKIVAGAMMVGYPKYQHRRMPDRDPLDVKWQTP